MQTRVRTVDVVLGLADSSRASHLWTSAKRKVRSCQGITQSPSLHHTNIPKAGGVAGCRGEDLVIILGSRTKTFYTYILEMAFNLVFLYISGKAMQFV